MDYERWAELADRDAAGETLKPDEREFLRQYAEEHPECHAELDIWQRLADFDFAPDELRERAVALKAVQIVQQGASRGQSRLLARRRNLFVGLGAIAVAAGVALAITSRHNPMAPTPAVAFAPIVLSTTDVRVDGSLSRSGKVPEGSTVEVSQGTACLEVGPAIFACLSPNSRVRATHLVGPKRRIDVISGSVAVALKPQPAGAHFSVVASDVWSTAVGTAFSVTVKAASPVETDVYEGKVLVGKEQTGEIVFAHKLGLSSTQGVRIDPLAGAPEGVEWKALEKVSGRHFGPEVSALPEEPAAQNGNGSATAETRQSSPIVKRSEGPTPAEPAAKSPEELLQRARQFRRDQQWTSAATAYRELQQRFPTSPEAHTSLVSLGEVELAYLGDPKRALSSFDAYLQEGGPLSVEAELGKIRVYRALGSQQEEKTAIVSFLGRHPDNAETSALRERLQVLETPRQ